MTGLTEALAFLTAFGGARAATRRAAAWFPVIGAALGLALGGAWWGLRHGLPSAVAAALVVAGDLGLTGLLHFDGLVDSADGLLPPLDRQRRLEVLRDPRAGAFGVVAAGAVLLVRWSALASMPAAPFLLAGLWCASRSAMTLSLASLPYARAEGLAVGFGGGTRERWDPGVAVGLAGIGGGLALGLIARRWTGIFAVGASLFGFASVMTLGQRRLGGYTGDVLGAAGVVGETLGLVAATAHW